jgi:hypothetical protein
MLTRLFRFLDPVHISSDLAARLHALAEDCQRLKFDPRVPQRILQAAPLLDNWAPVLTVEGLHLIGRAGGHPVHGDRMVMTTPLWWADPNGSWVRTPSRFYRLGSPADPEDIRRTRRLAGIHSPEDES